MKINSYVFPETDSLVSVISVKEAKNNSKNLAELLGHVVVINPDLYSRSRQYYLDGNNCKYKHNCHV